MNKWCIVKTSEENKIKYEEEENYTIAIYNEKNIKSVNYFNDTIVLITPSKEIAESTKKALDEQLQEQGD